MPDATDDPLHWLAGGAVFFHGYYDCYCYLLAVQPDAVAGHRHRDSLCGRLRRVQPGRHARRPAGGVFTLRQFAEQDGQSAPEPVPVDADMATRGDS